MGGIKVSSLVHEEQHLRWLGQGPGGCQRTWSERRLGAVCKGEAQSWMLRLVVELILGFRQRQVSRTGTAEIGAEWMAEGSKGRVYLQQVFPLGADKTWGGEVLCSR